MSEGVRHPVCAADDLPPGARVVRELGGRSVGVFNVNGTYYALHNRCPHRGGALCEGPLTGTTLPTTTFAHPYGLEGQVIRCAWHGWEFEIASGRCLVDERIRARSFRVVVEDGQVFVLMPDRKPAAVGV